MKILKREQPLILLIGALVLIILLMGAGLFVQRTTGKVSGTARTGEVKNFEDPQWLETELAYWKEQVQKLGGEAAYSVFKEEYKPFAFGDQHLGAHIIGEALYRSEGVEGFAVCDASFAFGCYHSFFGAALAELGTDVVLLFDKACQEAFGPFGTGCTHGIGHGILEYFGHQQLLKALETCDEMTTQLNPLFGCTSGVFMEYNTPTFVSATTASLGIRSVNEQNPYEPCNTEVPLRFRLSCYFELPQWLLTEAVFGKDYVRVGRLCSEIQNTDYKEVCFLGLGNGIAFFASYDVEKAAAACDRSAPNPQHALFCRAGAVWGLASSGTEAADRALLLCEDLSSALREECLSRAQLLERFSETR